MLTYTAATSYVADIFLRRVRVRFRVTVYTQLAVGVYWDSTPLTASAEIFKVYISFTLFTCDCTLIYTLMYCVCQHTDPGMAQKHRGLTRFEPGRYIYEVHRLLQTSLFLTVSVFVELVACFYETMDSIGGVLAMEK